MNSMAEPGGGACPPDVYGCSGPVQGKDRVTTRVFGEFVENECTEYLLVSFSLGSIPIQRRWRNNSFSAEFLADYWGTFFPTQDGREQADPAEIKDAVSFISNELLENAIKFADADSRFPITIGLYLDGNELRFCVTNSVTPGHAVHFQEYIDKVLTEDADKLYMCHVEDTVSEQSRLGLLTIINDYKAKLAWKFQTIKGERETIIVTTMVRLPIVRIEK